MLRVSVLTDKGTDIMEFKYKPADIDLMWHSPAGYRDPGMFAPTSQMPESAFMDVYGGGWQDILPSAGSPSKHRGAEWGVHGETPLLRWNCNVERESGDEVSAKVWVEGYRYPYRVEKWFSMKTHEPKLTIKEKVTNLSTQDLEFSWLIHPAFSEPFLSPTCTVSVPADTLVLGPDEWAQYGRLAAGKTKWPNAKSRSEGTIDLSLIPTRDIVAEETAFLTDLHEGRYLLSNPKLGFGFCMEWDMRVFPWLWFWQNYNLPDYPYFGRAWNIALEPCTSYPSGLAEQVKTGTARVIRGGSFLETVYSAYVVRSKS